MNNDIAIVFSFDNLNQLSLTELTIRTINITENIKILFACKEELIDNLELTRLTKKYNIEIVPFNNKKINGKFYWYFIPLITNFEYYLFLDNDLIFDRVDINKLFIKYRKKLKHKSFLGVRGHVWRVEKKKNFIRLFRKNYIDYLLKINKYINTGLVLVNGDNYRKLYRFEDIENRFFFHKIESKRNKLYLWDQEFLSINFYDDIDFISNRYNLRIGNKFWLYIFHNRKNKIYHYNLWRNYAGKYQKFDFNFYIKTISKDEMLEKLIDFWNNNGQFRTTKRLNKSLTEMIEIMYDSRGKNYE